MKARMVSQAAVDSWKRVQAQNAAMKKFMRTRLGFKNIGQLLRAGPEKSGRVVAWLKHAPCLEMLADGSLKIDYAYEKGEWPNMIYAVATKAKAVRIRSVDL